MFGGDFCACACVLFGGGKRMYYIFVLALLWVRRSRGGFVNGDSDSRNLAFVFAPFALAPRCRCLHPRHVHVQDGLC